MKLAEKVEEIRVARDLFPCCIDCGRNLSGVPLFTLRVAAERPNRFKCPEPCLRSSGSTKR